ncbi:S24 family peptidase [Vibrio metoecus]|uniref:S24 family peptidase n=1 Tax=Vibrio metoecus TaxID=1481663 RepID=UPI001594EC5E|nr:S24 family peptidase [Vibrio metoecus]
METLGKRVEWRRTQLKITQDELVTKVKKLLPDASFNRVTVSNIENEVQKSFKENVFLVVCRVLKCRPDWLAFGTGPVEDKGPNIAQVGPPVEQKCPILSWVQAGMWTEMGSPVSNEDVELMPCPVKCSAGTYVLRVRGDSMRHEYEEGDYLFVDPTKIEPANGDYVIAMLEDSKEATFKQYIELDGRKMLKATNPDYPPEMRFLPINGTCLVLGKVICSVRISQN